MARKRGLLEAGLRLTGALLQVLTAVLVARVTDPTTASQFFIGFATVTMVAVLCRAGFDQALTRFVASDLALGQARSAQAAIRYLLGRFLKRTAWIIPLLLAACAGVMFAPPITGHYDVLATALVPFLIAAPFFGIAALSGVALQAAQRPVLSVCSMFIIHNVVTMAAVLVPASLRHPAAFNYAFLLGSVLAAAFGSFILLRTLRKSVAAADAAGVALVPFRKTELRTLARENAWTVIGNLILTWGPMGLVGALATPLDAARFGIASRSAQLVSFALPALNFVLAPRFAALRATGRHSELRKALLGSTGLSLALSSVVAIPIIAMAGPIMQFFGPEYVGASSVLILLAAAQWANGAAGAAIQFLAMTGNERPLRRIFMLSASLAMAAGAPLVWMYGSVGAAILALGSSLLLNVLCTIVSLRSIRVRVVPAENVTSAVAIPVTAPGPARLGAPAT